MVSRGVATVVNICSALDDVVFAEEVDGRLPCGVGPVLMCSWYELPSRSFFMQAKPVLFASGVCDSCVSFQVV